MSSVLDQIDALKADLDSRRPLAPEIVVGLQKVFAAEEVDYIYESNAIEGNTLTLAETELVLNKGLTVGGKPLKDHLEATNHRSALQKLKEIASTIEPISEKVLLELHSLILRSIDDANAGRYRNMPVRISGSRHIPPNSLKVPELMTQLWNAYAHDWNQLHPVHAAADLHWRLVSVHPFIDGNGRTARLMMNLHLLRFGFPITIIRAERDQRRDYYHALSMADEEMHPGKLRVFIEQRVLESLQRFIGILNELPQ